MEAFNSSRGGKISVTSRTVCSTYWALGLWKKEEGEEKRGGGEEREKGREEEKELAQEMEEMWKELTTPGL